MSGHSKWHSIRHKKGAADARRGKLFTSLIKEITVAARLGGGDPDGNPRLRAAMAAAKSANMPGENIKRAVQKGTGELPGLSYEDAVYEGYGPGGVAILVEAVTDNKNRTVSDIRHVFSKFGGNLGQSGCVAHLFQRQGLILIDKSGTDEDDLMTVVLEAGAEDMRDGGEVYEIYTSPQDYDAVLEEIRSHDLAVASADLSMIPQTTLQLAGKPAQQMLRLMESLEDHDDVQKVFANFDIEDAELEAAAS
ncbi:MAG: YebC/PmpR family DNA-binding transcriptional regulator [Acidobacteriota bacterium]|nr:YebC/PmpR family DNA-binding transcriptional regulator [Acidobacteriota bacterium]MDE2963648.1 YebC/PmpR family DNA-binding transcriptional regulator [Acidobacteriota bacterium]